MVFCDAATGTCKACTTNYYTSCYNNDVYYYDSCWNLGSIKQNCKDTAFWTTPAVYRCNVAGDLERQASSKENCVSGSCQAEASYWSLNLDCTSSQKCNSVTGTCDAIPACGAPNPIDCGYTENTITVQWKAISGASQYNVQWCKTSVSGWPNPLPSGCGSALTAGTDNGAGNLIYTINGLDWSTQYKTRVRVETATGCIAPSSWTYECSLSTGNPPTFPACNKGSISYPSNGWSITNDCWQYKRICTENPPGCSMWDCNFGSGDITDPYTNDIVTIPYGTWKLTATMSNIRSYAKCHGAWTCIGSDCLSHFSTVYLALGLDGTPLDYKSTAASVWAEGDGTQESSGSGSSITIEKIVTCSKPGGCSLDVRRYFSFQGMAHRALWPGGSGDYYYGNVKADVSVSWTTGCISHSSYSCSDNDVYWYNSCGTIEDKKEECNNGNTWKDPAVYQCNAAGDVERKAVAKYCITDSCSSFDYLSLWQDCTSTQKCNSATGKCVECLTATDCKGTDGTYNTYCLKDSTVPNYILPTCTSNVCICENTCGSNTGVNALCASGYCCTGEKPQGPGESSLSSTCKPKSTISNPWLCT